MLKKTKLRALSPGQWARVRIPDYECWRKAKSFCDPKVGNEVDICIMPRYAPRYDTKNCFHWMYQVAYRSPGATWPTYESPSGGLWLVPSDFGLIETHYSSPNWDEATREAHDQGKGIFVYEPASDDPKLCPGGDWSRYECSLCGKFVKPFSNDQGDLICPHCEVTGLVITDDEQLDRLEDVREFARSMGLSRQLEKELDFLDWWGDGDANEGRRRQCVLSYDFAPHSFTFAHYLLPAFTSDGKRKFMFNGGLIYSGPGAPGDGSFPSLTVNLGDGTGWFCHT
jgi:hypothetical protein